MTAALQTYADRGVFRGFRATPGPRARIDYQFVWLTRRPVTATFDARTGKLAFPALLPEIDKTAALAVKRIVESRSDRDQPEHKRVDARRARLSTAIRNGDLSIAVTIRGKNYGYAVTHTLNVINELFVALHEHHPEYLVERFGVSAE